MNKAPVILRLRSRTKRKEQEGPGKLLGWRATRRCHEEDHGEQTCQKTSYGLVFTAVALQKRSIEFCLLRQKGL